MPEGVNFKHIFAVSVLCGIGFTMSIFISSLAFGNVRLAMAEAERYLPSLIEKIEGLLAKHGVPNDSIIMRVVGCPNGCGRAMLAEAGLVGKGPGKYNVYLGGNTEGTRIPKEPMIVRILNN